MNRAEFMRQLELLLQNVSHGEREEALQYYNDYFDDAGAENEQAVIEALGNPGRVAENIRRELSEIQGMKRATAADRAVVEYGQDGTSYPETPETGGGGTDSYGAAGGSAGFAGGGGTDSYGAAGGNTGFAGGDGTGSYGAAGGNAGFAGGGGTGSYGAAGGSAGFAGGGGTGSYDAAGESAGFAGGGTGGSGGPGGAPGAGGAPGKKGMSGGMMVLIAILAVFAAPFILGLAAILFGLLLMFAVIWFALILSFGTVVLAMFVALFFLLIVGGMCIPVDPLVGMALIGGGLVCGGVGILFLMLTAAMTGIVTPAIFRGAGHLFHIGRKKEARA